MIKWIYERFKPGTTSVFELDAPWDGGGDGGAESIYSFLERHTDPATGKIDAGRLPDEPEPDDSVLRWAAGALDGVMGHHTAGDGELSSAELVDLIVRAASKPNTEDFSRLYQAFRGCSALQHVDAVLEGLVSTVPESPPHLRPLAVRLATQAPEREPVKFGIALLGLVAEPEDVPILMTLGSHDEFTLFAVVALRNAFGQDDDIVWRIAKRLDGWGRIHAVERLAGTRDSKIREWMLREGFRNSIMYEYLALICAETGDLAAALEESTVDHELLLGSAEILDTLMSGMGPAGDIDDYEDAAPAIRAFLKHLRFAAADLNLLSTLTSIRAFLDNEGGRWAFCEECGWSGEVVEEVSNEVTSLLARDGWVEAVERGLNAEDSHDFYLAADAAPEVGIDPWEHHFRRLEQGKDHWFWVMKTDDTDRIDRVLAFAESALDLEKIASGPGTALGLGPKWKDHSHLDFIVQELNRFPGRGWRFLETALQSPVVRNRNMAIKVLDAWGESHWPDDTRLALIRARNGEPDEDVRERIEQLLETGALAIESS